MSRICHEISLFTNADKVTKAANMWRDHLNKLDEPLRHFFIKGTRQNMRPPCKVFQSHTLSNDYVASISISPLKLLKGGSKKCGSSLNTLEIYFTLVVALCCLDIEWIAWEFFWEFCFWISTIYTQKSLLLVNVTFHQLNSLTVETFFSIIIYLNNLLKHVFTNEWKLTDIQISKFSTGCPIYDTFLGSHLNSSSF